MFLLTEVDKMAQTGFTGISFPFRVGVKGGVVTSTTNRLDITHIEESIEQVLRTRPLERCMEYAIHSDIDYDIFEPNDSSTRTLIAYQVEQALSDLESRIEVKNVEVYSKDNCVYAEITFKVLKYDTVYTRDVKVGDLTNG
jgi:phage baseplate assembly protein W